MLRPVARSGAVVTLATLALARAGGTQPPRSAAKAAAAVGVVNAARQRTIPDVTGWGIDSATVAVRRRDVGVVTRDLPTRSVVQNRVVRQSPPAQTVIRGNMVETLYVARAPKPTTNPGVAVPNDAAGNFIPPRTRPDSPPSNVPTRAKVPDLLGLPLSGARTLLAQNNLQLLKPQAESSEVVSTGLVFQQKPRAKELVEPGSGVVVWYSLGPHHAPTAPPITMPNVVGRTVAEAVGILRKPELRVIAIDTARARGGNGTIDHQQPEAGALVHSGEAVTLHVTLPTMMGVVPAVIGMKASRARSVLDKSGFQLGHVTRVARAGADAVIFEQTPKAGESAQQGTFVDVRENMLVAPHKIVVPNLAGLLLDSATNVLTRDSLQIGRIGFADDGMDPHVVRQSPRAGDSVPLNQFVDVTLATPHRAGTTPPPPPPSDTIVQVPAVTGVSFERAREVLESSGLEAVAAADTFRQPRVIAQSPQAASFARIHSGVVLTLVGVEPPPVPDVVGNSQHAAEEHLQLDGFKMSVDGTSRVFWPLFERVKVQRPSAGERLSQDLPVHVDLTTPIVPPVPASIAAVVIAGALLVTRKPIWRSKPQRDSPRWRPIGELGFDVKAGAPSPPVLESAAGNLAKVVVSFEITTTAAPWQVTPDPDSLVER